MHRLRRSGLDLEYVSNSDLGQLDTARLWHQATPGPDFEKILNTFHISQSDSIIDVGCGKGGALISMANFGFGRITGIEYSSELHCIARENLSKIGIQSVTVLRADATNFEHYSDYNYIYLFNPFFGQVFDDFMQKVRESLVLQPRKLTILYLNPRCHSVVVQDHLFKKVEEFHFGYYPLFMYLHDPELGVI